MPRGWYHDGKASGGAALDLHIHDSDFIQYLFAMPRAVRSLGYSKISGEIDHISTQYLYDDVPLVHAEGCWCLANTYGFTMQYTANFEKATADFDLSRGAESLKLTSERLKPSIAAPAALPPSCLFSRLHPHGQKQRL
jgi:predicted dehydrogenase